MSKTIVSRILLAVIVTHIVDLSKAPIRRFIERAKTWLSRVWFDYKLSRAMRYGRYESRRKYWRPRMFEPKPEPVVPPSPSIVLEDIRTSDNVQVSDEWAAVRAFATWWMAGKAVMRHKRLSSKQDSIDNGLHDKPFRLWYTYFTCETDNYVEEWVIIRALNEPMSPGVAINKCMPEDNGSWIYEDIYTEWHTERCAVCVGTCRYPQVEEPVMTTSCHCVPQGLCKCPADREVMVKSWRYPVIRDTDLDDQRPWSYRLFFNKRLNGHRTFYGGHAFSTPVHVIPGDLCQPVNEPTVEESWPTEEDEFVFSDLQDKVETIVLGLAVQEYQLQVDFVCSDYRKQAFSFWNVPTMIKETKASVVTVKRPSALDVFTMDRTPVGSLLISDMTEQEIKQAAKDREDEISSRVHLLNPEKEMPSMGIFGAFRLLDPTNKRSHVRAKLIGEGLVYTTLRAMFTGLDQQGVELPTIDAPTLGLTRRRAKLIKAGNVLPTQEDIMVEALSDTPNQLVGSHVHMSLDKFELWIVAALASILPSNHYLSKTTLDLKVQGTIVSFAVLASEAEQVEMLAVRDPKCLIQATMRYHHQLLAFARTLDSLETYNLLGPGCMPLIAAVEKQEYPAVKGLVRAALGQKGTRAIKS